MSPYGVIRPQWVINLFLGIHDDMNTVDDNCPRLRLRVVILAYNELDTCLQKWCDSTVSKVINDVNAIYTAVISILSILCRYVIVAIGSEFIEKSTVTDLHA